MIQNDLSNKKWFNQKQLLSMSIAAHDEYIVASRGFGKSEGIDAPRLLRNVHAMPRSSGCMLSPTYAKLLQNTLPAVCAALARYGYVRDVHYVVGKKPPARLNFKRPLVEPFRYEYVMSWYNGSILHLVSFDRPMATNSMNLDYVLGFEAKFLPYKKIVDEVLQANRGQSQYFGHCPWHHGMVFTTDMPTAKAGQWIFEKEKQMDRELIEMILHTYALIKRYEARESNLSRQKAQQLRRDLDLFRQHAVFYGEFDIFDNLEIIGEKRIRELHRDLPTFIFNTSILNLKPTKIPNGFYAALSELHHYEPQNASIFEDMNYDFKKSTIKTWRHDTELRGDLPLRIAFDYNAAINNVVTGQVNEGRLLTTNWQFVKTPRKLKEMVKEWCDYYHGFPNNDVIYYFDHTAVAESADGDARPFYEIVTDELSARGWNVIQVYIGQAYKHDKKHNHIDLALKGDVNYLFPTFNKFNCEFLLMAMDQTGIKIGRNGFEKDKGSEKRPDTPEDPDELKTHGTDAWDTLFIGCNFFASESQSANFSPNWGK